MVPLSDSVLTPWLTTSFIVSAFFSPTVLILALWADRPLRLPSLMYPLVLRPSVHKGRNCVQSGATFANVGIAGSCFLSLSEAQAQGSFLWSLSLGLVSSGSPISLSSLSAPENVREGISWFKTKCSRCGMRAGHRLLFWRTCSIFYFSVTWLGSCQQFLDAQSRKTQDTRICSVLVHSTWHSAYVLITLERPRRSAP